jgi:hypothetical protein
MPHHIVVAKYNTIILAVALTITVKSFALMFPYPLLLDDAFAPGGIVSSISTVHALLNRGYSSIYEFAGSGIDLLGHGLMPHTASFILVGLTYFASLSWAIKVTSILKSILGFYFTSKFLQTRFSMGIIEATFGGLLFSLHTQITPVQASSQAIDQFGTGLSIDLIPMIIYLLYIIKYGSSPTKQYLVRLAAMFFIGCVYALSSTIPFLPIGLGFIIVWYLCEKAFGIDRLGFLIALVTGAVVVMFPIFYSFILDYAHSARNGFDQFSYYDQGGLKSLIVGYAAEFTSYIVNKKEFFLLILAGVFVYNQLHSPVYRITILVLFILFAVGRDFIQPFLSILIGAHLGIVRSVGLYTNVVSAFLLALLSAWGLSALRDRRLKMAVFACAIAADLSFEPPGNLPAYRTMFKSQGYIYNADILGDHDKLKALAKLTDGNGRLSTISVAGDPNPISVPGYKGDWLEWLHPVLPQAYGILTIDSYLNLSPRSLKEFYEKRIGSLPPNPTHRAYIEMSFNGLVKNEGGCFVQTAPIDLDSAGVEIGALRDAAVGYVISPVALKSRHFHQDALSDSGSQLACMDRGYLVWPESLGRPKIFIYRTDWLPEFVSVTRNVALNGGSASDNSQRSHDAQPELGPLIFLNEDDFHRFPGMSEVPVKQDELEIRERRPDMIRAAVKLVAPALVYFSYGFEWGWNGTIDGERATILAANFGFQAVWVPAGEHEVEIRRPVLPFVWWTDDRGSD